MNNISRTFLFDLENVYYSDVGKGFSSSFINDLELVFKTDLVTLGRTEAVDKLSIDEMGSLAKELEQWRRICLTELEKKIEDRDQDDPLRCPISLFGVMEYGRRETAHTRILSWFFDPIKEHGFGITLLNALLTFLNENNSTLIVREARAQPERLVSVTDKGGGGRTDIWIEGTCEERSNPAHTVPFLIVIEAKIDHSEGEEQLERYDWEMQRWIRRNSADEVKIYRIFMTPYGTLPQSRRKTKEWKALSFLKLSVLFARCLPSLKDKPGYHLLRFYLATIFKDVLHWPLPLRPEERNPYQALQYMTLLSQSRGEIR